MNQAADELWQTSSDVGEMAQLAHKLQSVIDRKLPLDSERLAKISDSTTGNKDDGLPPDQEEIGRIEIPLGSESVRMIRLPLPNNGSHWVFSQRTVEHVSAWYERLPDHFLLDHLPDAVLVTGPGGGCSIGSGSRRRCCWA